MSAPRIAASLRLMLRRPALAVNEPSAGGITTAEGAAAPLNGTTRPDARSDDAPASPSFCFRAVSIGSRISMLQASQTWRHRRSAFRYGHLTGLVVSPMPSIASRFRRLHGAREKGGGL